MKALCLTIALCLLSLPALAQGQGHGGNGGNWQHRGGNGWHGGYGRPSSSGGFLGGVIGGVVGGAIIDIFRPPVVVYQPPVVVVQPRQGPVAWTPDWFDYCQATYKSFDARSGYYRGYDGQDHFCR